MYTNFFKDTKWIKETIFDFKKNKSKYLSSKLPEDTWLLDDRYILTIPGDAEIRYPLGVNGYNFWCYSNGKMHSNYGLFSPLLKSVEGMEEKLGFFFGISNEDDQFDYFSLIPNMDDLNGKLERYTIFSPHQVFYVTIHEKFISYLRVFINKDKKTFFSIHIENLTEEPLKSYLCYYINPYLRHSLNEGGEDKWFRKTEIIDNQFVISTNEDISRHLSISNHARIDSNIYERDVVIEELHTTSRNDFLHGAKSINNSESLKKGFFNKCSVRTAFKEVGVCSKLTHLNIPVKGEVNKNICLRFNKGSDSPLIDALCLQNYNLIEKDLKRYKSEENIINSKIKFSCYSNNKNLLAFPKFFEHLKKQVEFCSTITGYVQLSELSLIGIRDIFQALEAYLYWNPNFVKNKMLEALNYTFTNGRCPRQYSLPKNPGDTPVMDLRPFIDQGVWVISSIVTYLKVTGDYDFLTNVCGYYTLLNSNEIERSNTKNSVLDHMFRIMNYLIENRCKITGCSYALYGDWNDALDGLGVSKNPDIEFGSGVSIMTSLQLYQNLSEMIVLLNTVYPYMYSNIINKYIHVKDELFNGLVEYGIVQNKSDRKILHGWGDNREYLIGSYNDPDGESRDGLTSNAFWILSGLIQKTPELKKHILTSLYRLDSKYGFKTFLPGFSPDCPGVGRIKKLPIGTAENGAVYVHASTFAVMSLFKIGEAQKAWDQLLKLLPFTHEKLSCSPFVIPNSYGENEHLGIDGESMLDWQTGSSNVVLKTLIRYALGIEADYRGIWIQPARWQPFSCFSLCLEISKCKLTLNYTNKGSNKRTFKINNEIISSHYCKDIKTEKIWIDKPNIINKEITIDVID